MTWIDQAEYATNLLPYSEDFSYWTKSNLTISENYDDGPFPGTKSFRLTDSSTSAFGLLIYPLNIDGTVERVFSAFIKKDSDETRFCNVRMFYTSVSCSLRLNTNTGDIFLPLVGSGITVTDYGVDDYDTYWRLWIASYKDTLVSVGLLPASAASFSGSASATAVGSITVFGAQLETGSNPTGYIKTSGAAVTVEKRGEWAIQERVT